jgi:predicted small lipoprotein YifL
MKMRLFLALSLVLSASVALAGCGVKTDLLMPNGKPTPKDQKDPSKPPPQNQQT